MYEIRTYRIKFKICFRVRSNERPISAVSRNKLQQLSDRCWPRGLPQHQIRREDLQSDSPEPLPLSNRDRHGFFIDDDHRFTSKRCVRWFLRACNLNTLCHVWFRRTFLKLQFTNSLNSNYNWALFFNPKTDELFTLIIYQKSLDKCFSVL